MNALWFLVPLSGALVGWAVVKIMVTIFLNQRKPRKVFGPATSGRLAKLVNRELFSFAEIEQKILTTGNFQKIIPEVEVHVDHFLAVKLKEKMPMVGMFVGERTLAQLKEVFMEELETPFPVIMRIYVEGLKSEVDIERMITERLHSIPSKKILAYIREVAYPQLSFLPFAGAFIGFITGCIQVLVILFIYK